MIEAPVRVLELTENKRADLSFNLYRFLRFDKSFHQDQNNPTFNQIIRDDLIPDDFTLRL